MTAPAPQTWLCRCPGSGILAIRRFPPGGWPRLARAQGVLIRNALRDLAARSPCGSFFTIPEGGEAGFEQAVNAHIATALGRLSGPLFAKEFA